MFDPIKIKNFCTTKDNVKRMRRQATDQDKVIAKDTSDIGILSKIYKELLKLNNKKTIQLKTEPKTLINTSPKNIYRW